LVLLFTAALALLPLLLVTAPGSALASPPGAASLRSGAQEATATPAGGEAPAPVATDQPAPQPQQTAGAAPVATGGAAVGGQGPASPTSPAPGGDFPWLIVLALALLLLGGLGYAVMRQRRPVEEAVAPAPAPVTRTRPDVRVGSAPAGAAATPTTHTTTTTVATTDVATPAAAGAAAVAAPLVASPDQGAAPGTVECPNCGTTNGASERFCHECGQDLRPLQGQQAAEAAVATPVDVVEADTPYLETMDRVDEQLEFVLSRARVVIGTASGNDIVIDSAFKGWRTVSPVHAELRREQDGFVLVDRGSEYGTFVNEMRTGENILADGDVVRLGDVSFIFRVPKVV
jgi:hypothetical protein